jgi:hypothetical protein
MATNTVFIIGAGASCELGMPAGPQLKKKVKSSLDFKFERGYIQTSGSERILNEIQNMQRLGEINQSTFDKFFQSAKIFTKGLCFAPSIDNYLNAHETNKELVWLGKMAIVELILEAEKSALKKIWDSVQMRFEPRGLADTWYGKLFAILVQGKTREQIREVFTGTIFIIFNYDRAVELVFPLLLSAHYGVDDEEAIEAFRAAKIIHPYGQIGGLETDPRFSTRQFGNTSKSLRELALEINTFTEGEQDLKLKNQIDDAISEASRIVFLGYGFIEMNNSILTRPAIKKVTKIFGTSYGLSIPNRDAVKTSLANRFQIPTMFRGNATAENVVGWRPFAFSDMHLSEGTCSEFFDEYSLVLSLAP